MSNLDEGVSCSGAFSEECTKVLREVVQALVRVLEMFGYASFFAGFDRELLFPNSA